ncbi:MAG: tyrosine-type recombinase/integrase, partial [Weissella confusa]
MKSFEDYLIGRGLSTNTRTAYLYASKQFSEMFDEITNLNLDAYKTYLQDNYSAKTINMRVNGMNAYLDYLGKADKRLRSVKIQQKPFLENVISKDEYARFISHLELLDDRRWYFAVRLMTCTGARVSELLKLNVSDVVADHLDIVSKGNKLRRIYI